MPSTLLFGINNEGRVHTLGTSGSMWRELPYVGQEFKKLSAIPHFLWALGGDHQVYVYVHGLDIPIRVREECYENERWIPIEGFSARLLPTDRYRYSSADGTVDRSIDKIRLPSMAWQWEGDWQIELILNGQPLDHHGWTYAVDFPATYHAKKQWSSCVRRRLWVRSRRYSALNSWCAIAPLHKDATVEPFIDISIGGQNVSGTEQGTMIVWAVTSHNRVMFRTGVSTRSPEGAKWLHISTPAGCEVGQLSVGPTGLVWAALLDGRALVRIGVTRDALSGESWVEIRAPGDGLKVQQLAVGLNAIWAVTYDKQVWFRKGVRGEGAGVSEELAVGSGWLEMVGRMSLVSVTANDQVFAVGADDRAVYYRMGVNSADLTGKRWRALHAPLQVSRASSSASLTRDRFQNRSNTSLNRPHSLCESSGIAEWEEQSHSAPTAPVSLPVGDLSDKHFETQLKNPKAWSPVRSVGSVVGTEVFSDESVYQSERQDSCIFAEDEELGWAEYEAPWSWVQAGACYIDTNQLPNWFAEMGGAAQHVELNEPWRLQILGDLKARLPDAEVKYAEYPSAVDTSSWVHTGEARMSQSTAGAFVDCVLQLEWMDTSGTLTILHPDGTSAILQFSMAEVFCTQCTSEPGNPRLVVHTPHLTPPFVRLQFASDTMMEEWQGHFASVGMQVHNCSGQPTNSALWATTNQGDAFVVDSALLPLTRTEDELYALGEDLSGRDTPISIPLHGSVAPGTLITLNGCVPDDADRFSFNLDAYSTYKLRHKAHAEYENELFHLNPRLADNKVVLNARIEDKWGDEEHASNPFARGQEFVIKILARVDDFLVLVNGAELGAFKYRMPVTAAQFLAVRGRVQMFKFAMQTPVAIMNPKDLFFRQVGGHLRRVETCRLGVTWGIGYDHTAWVYNGGWGGGFMCAMDSNNVNPMGDSQDYRVYENQRWNPMTGYTSTGLPTDRHMWSDVTGKQKRTCDQVKLQSHRWQWISDWLVDFHVPGGVDRDGWQYAVDFPSTYHANKQFTDCVRRRRWYRRCAVSTSGPWQELGHTKLVDVSLEPISDEIDAPIAVWALAAGGQAMVRTDVCKSNPTGSKWEHVPNDQCFTSLSCGPYYQVWATGKNGCAYARMGITTELHEGDKWYCVEPPSSAQLKQIAVGGAGVWAVDTNGRIQVRKEMSLQALTGTYWHCISIDPILLNSAPNTNCFKQVSVGDNDVWAVTDGGVIARRLGVCAQNPIGSGWDLGIPGNWQHICVKAFKP